MSQLDSAPVVPNSDSPLFSRQGEPVEPGELSNWTSVQSIVQISETDRQILEIHVEQLVDELVSRELDNVFTDKIHPHSTGSSWATSHALALQPSPPQYYPLALPASSSASNLALYVPLAEEPASLLSNAANESSVDLAASQLQNLQHQNWQDRVLLGSGILALLVMLTSSLISQMHGFPVRLRPQTSIAQNQRDPFLDYLQKALQRVNNEPVKPPVNPAMQSPAVAIAQAPVPPGNSVTIPLPSPPPPIAAQPTYPVYATNGVTTAVAPASLSAAPKSVPPSTLPQIPIATLPPPPPMGELTLSVPSLSPAGTGGLLPPPPSASTEQAPQDTGIPNPVYPPAVAVVAPSKMATPPASNRPARTLTGVMQMGDQSLALIEVNGVTRRIRLGEAISADGAVLMQVGDQEAIVQKGQDQYTIQVGQRF